MDEIREPAGEQDELLHNGQAGGVVSPDEEQEDLDENDLNEDEDEDFDDEDEDESEELDDEDVEEDEGEGGLMDRLAETGERLRRAS